MDGKDIRGPFMTGGAAAGDRTDDRLNADWF